MKLPPGSLPPKSFCVPRQRRTMDSNSPGSQKTQLQMNSNIVLVSDESVNEKICHYEYSTLSYKNLFWRYSCKLKAVKYIFLAFRFIDRTAEDMTETGVWEGKWHIAKGPRPGFEPTAAAAKTKPLYMGHHWAKFLPHCTVSTTKNYL